MLEWRWLEYTEISGEPSGEKIRGTFQLQKGDFAEWQRLCQHFGALLTQGVAWAPLHQGATPSVCEPHQMPNKLRAPKPGFSTPTVH